MGTQTNPRTRRGDLAVIERVIVSHSRTDLTEITEYAVVLVSNITREGRVKAIKDPRWSDDGYAQPLDRIVGFRRIYIVPQTDIDVAAAIATARSHVYPGHNTPRSYDSLDEVRTALKPHRRGTAK